MVVEGARVWMGTGACLLAGAGCKGSEVCADVPARWSCAACICSDGLDGLAVGADDLHAEEMARGVLLELHHHLLEHLEGLRL